MEEIQSGSVHLCNPPCAASTLGSMRLYWHNKLSRCPALVFKEFGPIGSSYYPNAMKIEVNNVEEKAVHSWSRISSAGQKALEEALRVFNPMSKDLSDTETQLVAFLQGLKEEGYQPTVLRSKDVYGYSSCTADTPSQTQESTRDDSDTGAAVSDCTKAPVRSPAVTAEVPGTLAEVSVSSPSVRTKPVSKGSATNLLLNSLKETRSGTSKASAMGFPANMYPDVYPAMRLSVVLEALVPLEATASCLESKYKQGHLGISPSDLKLLKASGASRQNTKLPSGQFDPKGYKHVVKKAPDSPALAVTLLKGTKGGVLKESNGCKASGILNGRITGSSSQCCSGGSQAKAFKNKAKEVPVGRTDWKDSSSQETVGQKRKRAEEVKEAPQKKKKNIMTKPELSQSTLNLLRSRAIKVDSSSSDDDVRRRAQKILRVNLSPVIRIQPLSPSHNVP
ncbi:coiled-coil domain-containing protein 71 isoform X1 [Malaclemys terrapin pileata]|uniref:coiled-coil domain-containing protein 71 isoform X1 n=2 Tax=Malaclemys terrapin pileata TaxID=2991368 RepID=UPI0023A87A22|nr:coiled-coil domain-containing protein 71 isoform X1 [Malaclemys terrapin pileata]